MVCTSLGSLLRPLFYFLCYIHFSLSVLYKAPKKMLFLVPLECCVNCKIAVCPLCREISERCKSFFVALCSVSSLFFTFETEQTPFPDAERDISVLTTRGKLQPSLCGGGGGGGGGGGIDATRQSLSKSGTRLARVRDSRNFSCRSLQCKVCHCQQC